MGSRKPVKLENSLFPSRCRSHEGLSQLNAPSGTLAFAKTIDTKKTSVLAASWNIKSSSSRNKCPSGPFLSFSHTVSLAWRWLGSQLPFFLWFLPDSQSSFDSAVQKMCFQWISILLKLARTGFCCLQLKTLIGTVMEKTHVVLKEKIGIQEFKI